MNDKAFEIFSDLAKRILGKALREIADLGLSPELTYLYDSPGGQRTRHWQTIKMEHVSFTDGDLARRDQYKSNLEKATARIAELEVELARERAARKKAEDELRIQKDRCEPPLPGYGGRWIGDDEFLT